MKKILVIAPCLFLTLLARNVQAGVSYWDNNGTATPTSGTWDTTTANWTTSTTLTASTVAFTSGNFAIFTAGSGGIVNLTVTVPGAVSCDGLGDATTSTGTASGAAVTNLTFSGAGSISLPSGAWPFECGNSAPAPAIIINVPITGTGGIIQHNNGTLALYGNNTYSGGTELTGGQVIYYNNNNSFGTGPITNNAGAGALVGTASTALTIPNNFVFTGNYSLNLAGGLPVGGAPGTTFTGNFSMPSGSTVLYTSSTTGELIKISGIISGSGAGINVQDNGILQLAGANTYTGPTTVTSPATLAIVGSGSLGSGSYAGLITNNYIFNYASSTPQTLSGIINGSGNLFVSNSAALTLTAANAITNNLSIYSGSLTIGGTGYISNATYAGRMTNNGSFIWNSTASETLSGVISGTGTVSEKAGTLTLSGANTFSGGTTITGGTLVITSDGNLGATSGPLTINAGTGAASGAGLKFNAANISLSASRSVVLGANGGTVGVPVADGTCVIPGVISGTGSFQSAFSYNSLLGTLKLSGANTYSGTTTIAGGTLQLGVNGALPFGTPLALCPDNTAGGVFDLNNFSQTIGPLTTNAGIGAGTNAVANPSIKLTGTLTVLETNSTVFSGTITSSGGTLAVIGSNNISGPTTLTLSATNSYAGNTTISNGTLALASTGSINNSPLLMIYQSGTFDVSAYSSYNLSGSTALYAAGAGAAQGTTAAAINGASGGVVSLGSQPINLFYTPASSSGDAAHPALEVLRGALTLNNNQIEVSNTTAIPMGIGTYTVIQVTDGVSGIINGTPNTNIIVIGGGQGPGSGLAAGTVATASVVNSTVVLTVAAAATNTTTVTVSSPTTYGSAITATVSPVPNGGIVQFFANGAPLGSPVAVNTGTGVATLASPALAAATYASFTAAYSGSPDGTFSASSTTPETLVVGKAPVTVTATAQSTPYGTLLTSVNGSGSTLFTSSGWQYSDTNATVTLTTSPYTTNTAAGSYNIVPSAAAGGSFTAANYTITYVNGTLTVTPVALTITPTAQSKTYGAMLAFGSGTTSSKFTVSPTPFPNGQTAASMTLTLTCSGGVSNAPVSGSPYTITPSAAVAASGATNFNPANYTITYNTNSLTVNPLPVVLTGTQVYDSTTNAYASTLSVSNKVSDDDVSLTAGPGGMVSAYIGTNAITSLGTLALAGTTAGNYTMISPSGAVVVTPLPVTLTGTRPYDGTNDAAAAILTVATNYDGANLTLSGSATLAGSAAGVQSISSFSGISLGGSAATNYTLTGASGSVTITAATPAFSGLTASQAITYGTPTITLGGVVEAAGPIYPASGETITVTINGTPQNTTLSDSTGDFSLSYSTATLPASGTTYTITYAYGGDSSFTNAADTSTALTVNPLPVILTGSEPYNGTPTAAFGYLTVANAINSDVVTVASGTANLAGATVGPEAIISAGTLALGGANAGNYTLAGVSGTVTVGAVPLSITANAQSTSYGALIATGPGSTQFTSIGLQPGDLIASVTLAISGYASNSPIGMYTITPSAATGTFNPADYSPITYNTGSLTVNPLSVILTGTQVYDSTTNAYASDLSVSNELSGDDVSLTNGPGGMDSADIGTNAITSLGSLALAGSTASNYSLSGASGSVIVTPLAVTLTGTRPYDGTNDASSSILTVVTNYDGANLTLSGSATLAGSAAGSQSISDFTGLALGGTAATNYTLTGASGSVSITTVPLTIAANPVSKTYGTAITLDPTAFAVSGGPLVGSELVTAVTMTATPAGTAATDPVGIDTLTPSAATGTGGFLAANYNISYVTNSLTVNPLPVSLNGGSRPYDGATDAASTLLTIVNDLDGANLTLASGNAVLASASVGVQPITSVGTLALGGSADGNYTLTGATLGTVTITNPYNVISNTASLDMSGTNFVVCWASVPGVTYTVLTNSSLNPPVTWTSAGTTTATDTNTCFTLPGGIMSNTNVNVVIQQ